MSDSVRPHRRQPTWFCHPWDSPGKNTAVGCHFLLQCVKVKSLSRVRLCATPWTAAHQAPPSMGFSRQECWSGVPSPSPLWMLAVHIKVMSHTNRVFINQNIVLQHQKHLLQKQTLKTKTNNTWWKHIYRISLFFFYLKIVLHMIISSEILYARKILIPNSRLSWITHSLYVSNYASYPSLPDRSFKKNMPNVHRSTVYNSQDMEAT